MTPFTGVRVTGLALLLSGCVGSDADPYESDGHGPTHSSGNTQGKPPSRTTSSTSGASEGTSATGATTGPGREPSTTGTSADGGSDGAGTCGGLGTTGNSTGSRDPWLEVIHAEAPVEDGTVLDLSCGGQGLAMFELFLFFGGFEPDGIYAPLKVVLDVPGYNTGPVGPFYAYEADLFLACNQPEPYHLFPLFPPDTIADWTVLNGVPATLSMELETPAGTVDMAASLTLGVDPGFDWATCTHGRNVPAPGSG